MYPANQCKNYKINPCKKCINITCVNSIRKKITSNQIYGYQEIKFITSFVLFV